MILITSGEPAGIGPDIILKLAMDPPVACQWVVLADRQLLQQRAQQLRLPLQFNDYIPTQPTQPQFQAGVINVWHVPLNVPCKAGVLNPANVPYVMQMLMVANAECVARRAAALVTAPVHKAVINQAGIAFSGHTELLAQLTATPQVVMMLATKSMRVALATTHIPVSQVAMQLNQHSLVNTIKIISTDLKRCCGIIQPAIYVAGLNPHAGEAGYLGMEEINIITPALQQCAAAGLNVFGPFPADTMFTPQYRAKADVFLAMYHDQGLPVLKYDGFGEAVNITLGLPFIRTSVDHGTALELAGSGKASESSLRMALVAANNMRICEDDYKYNCCYS